MVSVDSEPVAYHHSRSLLDEHPGATIIQADMRDRDVVLAHPETQRLLDFSQPIALLVVGVLLHLPDPEPVELIRGYREHLAPRLGLPADPENGVHVYHQFTMRPPDRAATIAALEQRSIGYGIYYPTPTHLQAPFASAERSLPVTEQLSQQVLSIPVRPDLSADELEEIVSTLNSVVA